MRFHQAIYLVQWCLEGTTMMSQGTDSPYRETANINDGSMFTADMAVHNAIGDSFRGATWVSIHNGGGVGWGEVINGGFGMLLDGSDAGKHNDWRACFTGMSTTVLHEEHGGVIREPYPLFNGRWKRNQNSRVTLPTMVDDDLLDEIGGWGDE